MNDDHNAARAKCLDARKLVKGTPPPGSLGSTITEAMARGLRDDIDVFLYRKEHEPRSPPHAHPCPECYEDWPCARTDCSVWPIDTSDEDHDGHDADSLQRGGYVVCPVCQKAKSHE